MKTVEELYASFLSTPTGEAIASMEMVEEQRNQPKRVLPKPLKIEKPLKKEKEDRISPLPDSLILQILSLSPSTKDAIITGTLSKQWKSLWTEIPTLIFQQNIVSYRRDDRLTSEFVWFVNRTITQCRHSKLKKFKVYIRYDIRLQSQINDWIRYAVSRNVEELGVKLCDINSGDKCVLDQEFFINSCFTDLRLKGFMFNPNGAISWKMLRNLCISSAYLREDLIDNILLGSPVLETLELDHCYGYKRLDITSKSVKNFVLCGYVIPSHDHDVIEINAPNILSLKIHSELVLEKLLLVDVSSLVEAELDYTKHESYRTFRKEAKEEMLKGLIQSLHHAKELKVGSHCAMVFYRLQAKGLLSSPTNIKVSRMW